MGAYHVHRETSTANQDKLLRHSSPKSGIISGPNRPQNAVD